MATRSASDDSRAYSRRGLRAPATAAVGCLSWEWEPCGGTRPDNNFYEAVRFPLKTDTFRPGADLDSSRFDSPYSAPPIPPGAPCVHWPSLPRWSAFPPPRFSVSRPVQRFRRPADRLQRRRLLRLRPERQFHQPDRQRTALPAMLVPRPVSRAPRPPPPPARPVPVPPAAVRPAPLPAVAPQPVQPAPAPVRPPPVPPPPLPPPPQRPVHRRRTLGLPAPAPMP